MGKRTAYIAELEPTDLAVLGFLAGVLNDDPRGNEINNILARIQVVEVEDTEEDTTDEDRATDEGMPEAPEQRVALTPVEDTSESQDLEGYSNVDPESLGIDINLPAPPPPPPPINRPNDFGAGPGPGL